jgi:glycosyltransferase involved in cell wall biosynthesis
VRKDTFFHRTLLKGRPHIYPLSWTGISKVSSFFELARAVREFAPDVVSINRERDIIRVYGIVKLMGPFLRKRPAIVAVFHNLGWRSSWILKHLDGVIFPNRYMRESYLRCIGNGVLRSEVIYHGVPLPEINIDDKFNRDRRRRFFKEKGFPIIGMVGEMRKNQTELIDVAHHLKQKLRDFTVVLIGRGTDQEISDLQKKIDDYGLTKNVFLIGRVDRVHIPDIFHDLDISVTTNRIEPFGMVFIESLASYTPLIAYNSGGPVEILEKGGGILVDGGPKEMAEALFRVVSDDASRKALGISGRNAVERYFSINAMGENHLRFYRSIVG